MSYISRCGRFLVKLLSLGGHKDSGKEPLSTGGVFKHAIYVADACINIRSCGSVHDLTEKDKEELMFLVQSLDKVIKSLDASLSRYESNLASAQFARQAMYELLSAAAEES